MKAEDLITSQIVEFAAKKAQQLKRRKNWFGLDAEDLAQEALIRVTKAINKGSYEHRDPKGFEGFITLTIINLAKNGMEKYMKGENEIASLDQISGDTERSYDPVDNRSADCATMNNLKELTKLVDRLSPRRKEVIELEMQGYRVRDTAKKLGKSTATVSQLRFNAIKDLREMAAFII